MCNLRDSQLCAPDSRQNTPFVLGSLHQIISSKMYIPTMCIIHYLDTITLPQCQMYMYLLCTMTPAAIKLPQCQQEFPLMELCGEGKSPCYKQFHSPYMEFLVFLTLVRWCYEMLGAGQWKIGGHTATT